MKKWHYKVVYNPSGPVNNPLFFIRKLKYKKQYLHYVNASLSKSREVLIDFPYQNSLGGGDTIYIRKYLEDSLLVEFYSPNRHDRIWGYTTGYIHRSFIHDTLKIDQ